MFTQSRPTPSALVGAKTETEERIKEPNSEKGQKLEQVSNLQYSETNVEVASKMTKVEEGQLEIKHSTRQDGVEDPRQTDSEYKLESQLGRLRLQDHTPRTTRPVREMIGSPNLEELAAPTSPVEEQKDSGGKCDFLVPDIAENSPLPFGFLSPNAETHPPGVECAQPYSRIPARPVVTGAMRRPLLLFNDRYCHFPLSNIEGDQNFFKAIIL